MTGYAYSRQTVIAFIYSAASWSSDSLSIDLFTLRDRHIVSDFRLINGRIWVQQTTRASAEHRLVCRLYAESTHTNTHNPQSGVDLGPLTHMLHASTYMHDETMMMSFFSGFCVCALFVSRPRNNEVLRG